MCLVNESMKSWAALLKQSCRIRYWSDCEMWAQFSYETVNQFKVFLEGTGFHNFALPFPIEEWERSEGAHFLVFQKLSHRKLNGSTVIEVWGRCWCIIILLLYCSCSFQTYLLLITWWELFSLFSLMLFMFKVKLALHIPFIINSVWKSHMVIKAGNYAPSFTLNALIWSYGYLHLVPIC